MALSEKKIQKAVAEALDYSQATWWHTPNESTAKVEWIMEMKKHGLKPGVPDVIIASRNEAGNPSALELKSNDGRLQSSQSEMLQELTKDGWNCAVTYGLDEALNQLRDWGYIKQ